MNYQYNGAKSLVLLHEKHINDFYKTWQLANNLQIELPSTEDPDYNSLNTLLRHVLRSARGYMVWICENLDLPDPQINISPNPESIEDIAGNYIQHLLEKWRFPLQNLEEDKFVYGIYKSNWGTNYCIDAMMEHAVMHPLRHQFQLENLMKENVDLKSKKR